MRKVMPGQFQKSLIAAINRHDVNLAEISRATGVSYGQLRVLTKRPGASTNVEDAFALARYFGCTLDEFLLDTVGRNAHIAGRG